MTAQMCRRRTLAGKKLSFTIFNQGADDIDHDPILKIHRSGSRHEKSRRFPDGFW